MKEVLAAVGSLPTDLDWAVLAQRVVPVFPRVRPHPASFPDPLRVIVPPGVTIGFGIDMGAAFVAVTHAMMEIWGLSGADVLARSLSNLERRATTVSPGDVVRQVVDDVPVMLLQSGTASGSAFVLLPEELHRLFGPEPKLLAAPMRDLLIALPIDADRMLAAELFDLFASQDPNCLAPIGYLLRSGRVTIDELVPGLVGAALAPSSPQPFH